MFRAASQLIFWTAISMFVAGALSAGPRAREAGVPFDGTTGPLNAITDVAGVEVGQVTLIEGDGPLIVGQGPVRTGVTAIFPKGKAYSGFVYSGTFSANGTGEMTGRALIDEIGEFSGPIVLTGSGSVGVAHASVQSWYARRTGGAPKATFLFALPVIAETFDGDLNDTFGQHIKADHVLRALEGARNGPVDEGSVGGGTGMVAYGFKAGIGTSSRDVVVGGRTYTVGALVQANYGDREQMIIAGVPIGHQLAPSNVGERATDGSIIVIIATNAPLLPHQLRRLALRATHGLARVGGMSGTTSGDLFLAFSTERPTPESSDLLRAHYVDSFALNPLLVGAALATEEAIINSLVAGRTMRGINGHTVEGLPVEEVRSLLRNAGRLQVR